MKPSFGHFNRERIDSAISMALFLSFRGFFFSSFKERHAQSATLIGELLGTHLLICADSGILPCRQDFFFFFFPFVISKSQSTGGFYGLS